MSDTLHDADRVAEDHADGQPSPAAQISRGTVQLIRKYAGRGPTQARTAIARDTVTVVLSDTLTKAEQKLVEHGETEIVIRTRDKVQEMMRPELIDLVQTTLGRQVLAFLSANHLDPDVGAEIFVLEPDRAQPAG